LPTSNPGFAREAYESTVGLPDLLPISESASAPIADHPDSVSLNDSVAAPVTARFNALCLLAFITCFFH
jgi:hypothetical protein